MQIEWKKMFFHKLKKNGCVVKCPATNTNASFEMNSVITVVLILTIGCYYRTNVFFKTCAMSHTTIAKR